MCKFHRVSCLVAWSAGLWAGPVSGDSYGLLDPEYRAPSVKADRHVEGDTGCSSPQRRRRRLKVRLP